MRIVFVLLLAGLLGGCALTVSDPRALRPIEGFVPLAGDARVWVEPGYEAYGARVAAELPRAIAQVEAAHYLPFARTPRVYVCGSETCFKRWVLTPRVSAAVVPDNRLILSPNLDGRERGRLPALLVHELSHLHLGQRIGHYHNTVPIWFHEGWASLVAGGGGAEFASDATAHDAVRAGRRINPDARDLPGNRHRAQAFNLNVHEFYRQSMHLVGWLKNRQPDKFREFVLLVQDNMDFEIAFWQVYGAAPSTVLAGYFEQIAKTAPADQAAPAAPGASR